MQEVKNRKMKNKFKMLIFAMIFNAGFLNAQTGLQPGNLPELPSLFVHFNEMVYVPGLAGHTFHPGYLQQVVLKEKSHPVFLKTYPYTHLPFFCKVEADLEKTVSFPVKLRLGDVGYVDRLEGKRPQH